MNKKITLSLILLALVNLQTGCVGFGAIHPFQYKPYTLFSEGDQYGRDQLANRYLVAQQLAPVKGLSPNTIISVLGQPQDIRIVERGVAEDWVFVYYHKYKAWPVTEEGSFVLQFYDDKVINLVSLG